MARDLAGTRGVVEVADQAGCELLPRYYRAYGLQIRSAITLPGLHEVPACEPDVVLEVDEALVAAGAEDLCRLSTEQSTLVRAGVGTLQITDGAQIAVRPSGDHRELAHVALGPGMCLLLQQRGFFCLHASAVRIADEVVAFAGDSGEGKSTMAAAMNGKGFPLVSDDLLAVKGETGGLTPVVHPGPSGVRLWPGESVPDHVDPDRLESLYAATDKCLLAAEGPMETTSARLSRVYLLESGDRESVEKLDGLRAAVALLRYCYFPELQSAARGPSDLLQRCSDLSDRVQVARLVRRRDLEALPNLVELVSSGFDV